MSTELNIFCEKISYAYFILNKNYYKFIRKCEDSNYMPLGMEWKMADLIKYSRKALLIDSLLFLKDDPIILNNTEYTYIYIYLVGNFLAYSFY